MGRASAARQRLPWSCQLCLVVGRLADGSSEQLRVGGEGGGRSSSRDGLGPGLTPSPPCPPLSPSSAGRVPQAGRLYLLPPYLCFLSLDRRSARFTVPLFCIRRVERLNSRAGVFALGIGLWHGLRLVRPRSMCPLAQEQARPPCAGARDEADYPPLFDLRQILQLTSLLPTAEHFCILLRDALRAQVRPTTRPAASLAC